jgi:hypothetical protein
MTNKHTDKAKGRAKEAAGALTGNRRLKRVAPVNMLTVIVVLVPLLTGCFSHSRRSRRT